MANSNEPKNNEWGVGAIDILHQIEAKLDSKPQQPDKSMAPERVIQYTQESTPPRRTIVSEALPPKDSQQKAQSIPSEKND